MQTKIYNMDCLLGMRKIPSGSIDLVVTDCPYRISEGGGMKNRGHGCMLSSVHQTTKDGKLYKSNDIAFKEWLPVIYRVLKPNAHCYIMVNVRNMSELQREAEKVGFHFHNLVIWDKGNSTPNRWYMQAYECIMFFSKGKAFSINNPGTSNILRVRNIHRKRYHPTEKPVSLMQVLIENSSQRGDIVLDPFMGSGSTGVAAQHLGRNFVGFEKDKSYFDIAQNRLTNEARQLELFDFSDNS